MADQYGSIQTKFSLFITALNITLGTQESIVALGERPTYPEFIQSQTDIQNTIDAQTTYDSDLAALKNTLVANIASQRAAELAVIQDMGLDGGSGYAIPNNWIELTMPSPGYWIGCDNVTLASDGQPILNYTTTEPLVPYINQQ